MDFEASPLSSGLRTRGKVVTLPCVSLLDRPVWETQPPPGASAPGRVGHRVSRLRIWKVVTVQPGAPVVGFIVPSRAPPCPGQPSQQLQPCALWVCSPPGRPTGSRSPHSCRQEPCRHLCSWPWEHGLHVTLRLSATPSWCCCLPGLLVPARQPQDLLPEGGERLFTFNSQFIQGESLLTPPHTHTHWCS